MRPGRVAVALEIAAFAHYCLFSHAPGIFQIIFSFLCHWILSVGYWIFVVFVNFFVHRQKNVDVIILSACILPFKEPFRRKATQHQPFTIAVFA